MGGGGEGKRKTGRWKIWHENGKLKVVAKHAEYLLFVLKIRPRGTGIFIGSLKGS